MPEPRPPDPTRVETGDGDPSTVDAPVRWSGSAAVVPPEPRRPRWRLRRTEHTEHTGPEDDRETIPAVDPWAGQDLHDTPWDPMQLPPAPEPMPPTRVEAPAPQPSPPPAPQPSPPPAKPAPTLPPEYAQRYLTERGPRYQERPLPPPAPPRMRRRPLRRFLRRLLLLIVLAVLAYFLWPVFQQVNVSAILPDSVADLSLRDDGASRRATERLRDELGGGEAFAGVYGDGDGKRVTVFGTTGTRLTPKADLTAQIEQLGTDYDLRDVQSFDLGELGAHERCGVGKAGRNTVVVCAWADHGSLATVLLTRRSVADSADLTANLRDAVLQRG
ncbi:hypothetical protein AB0M20_34925 [Actinoplanes sp. NPDC051633]|uniref:hypothetical protein n=1 Tax=Actinoplanes sp. NPDC051633 TaxID=3155670 RepID=UPI003417E8DA